MVTLLGREIVLKWEVSKENRYRQAEIRSQRKTKIDASHRKTKPFRSNEIKKKNWKKKRQMPFYINVCSNERPKRAVKFGKRNDEHPHCFYGTIHAILSFFLS